VGIRNIAGLLAGGMTNWRQERHPAGRTERVGPEELLARLREEPQLQLLDVRERTEWEGGHVPGSQLVPWHDIAEVPESLDAARPIATICSGGVRAATAASLLKRAGADQVIHVIDGGVPALARLGLELESAAPAGLVG
jgi:rhodanese-related sulfurtransferase